MKNRVYSEDEMQELLKRASALQQNNGGAHTGTGLTLSEMEEVAAEAGLDPLFLRQAALEMEGRKSDRLSLSSDTTATHNLVDRFIPGTVKDEAWDDLVAELRHRFDTDAGQSMGMPGYGRSVTEKNGNIYEWRHTSMMGVETRALLRPRGEGFHLQMSQRVGWGSKEAESSIYGFIVAFMFGSVSGAFGNSVLIGFLAFFLTFLACGALIYFLDDRWRKKKHRELHKLADRAVGLLTMNFDQVMSNKEWTFDENEESRIDASLLDDEEDATDAQSRSRTKHRS